MLSYLYEELNKLFNRKEELNKELEEVMEYYSM